MVGGKLANQEAKPGKNLGIPSKYLMLLLNGLKLTMVCWNSLEKKISESEDFAVIP